MEKNNFGMNTIRKGSKQDLLRELIGVSNDFETLKADLESFCGIEDTYDGPKIVVYAGTQNRYSQMERSAKMLLANSEIDKIYFFVEDDIYPNELPDIITTINAKDQNYFPIYSPNANTPWTYMALIRLALHNIFPQYDRILWLDTDTLILADISKVFEAPLNDYYYFGAVKENRHYIEYLSIRKIEDSEMTTFQSYPRLDPQDYYNSGILLENLSLLRKDGTGDKLIAKVNNHRMNFPDQNVINQLCRNRIYTLSHEYNWSYFTGDEGFPRIVHTSSGKLINGLQEIADFYDTLSFEEIIAHRNKKKFVCEEK